MTDEIIAFHNMILSMEGKEPPLFVVQLSGTEEEKDYVYEKEREFVTQAGYDAKYKKDISETLSFSGTIIFCDHAPKDTLIFPIDCTFAENELVPAWVKDFIAKTHFTGVAGKDLMNDPRFSDLKQSYDHDPIGTITKTILTHFKTGKGAAFLSSDLNWLEQENDQKKTESDDTNVTTAEQEAKQKTELDTKVETETTKTDEPKVTETIEAKSESEVEQNDSGEEKTSDFVTDSAKEPKVSSSVTVQEVQNVTQDVQNVSKESATPEPPKPDAVAEAPKKKIEKETLTPEEEAENESLLADLVADYKNAIQSVRDTRNPGFRIIEKKLNECINKNEFNTQFCRIYMEISNDYSTALYAALYALDNKTKEFREKITHRVAHFGCPQCGNEWDEDLTFRPKGLCEITCPKCGQGRMFEV
jgi:hypothetical protein